MNVYRHELLDHLRDQAAFAAGYSPLYQQVGDWLENKSHDPAVTGLLEAAQHRSPFDVTLLLLAGLHRAVLASDPGAVGLRAYGRAASPIRSYGCNGNPS